MLAHAQVDGIDPAALARVERVRRCCLQRLAAHRQQHDRRVGVVDGRGDGVGAGGAASLVIGQHDRAGDDRADGDRSVRGRHRRVGAEAIEAGLGQVRRIASVFGLVCRIRRIHGGLAGAHRLQRGLTCVCRVGQVVGVHRGAHRQAATRDDWQRQARHVRRQRQAARPGQPVLRDVRDVKDALCASSTRSPSPYSWDSVPKQRWYSRAMRLSVLGVYQRRFQWC